MSDLISRQAAIDAVKDAIISAEQPYAEDALRKLPSAEPERKWIPVTERLPKNHEDVLVYGIETINNKYLYAVKCWDVDTWRPLSAPSVSWIAWQPLPEPAKIGDGK